MPQIDIIIGMYDNNPALFALLYRLHGYRLYGEIDYHALQTKKAGYGEPKPIVDINELIFTANNIRWYEPHVPQTMHTWQIDAQIRQHMATYLQHLSAPTFITDARMSHTLPFWQSVLTNTAHELFVVMTYDNPFTWAHHMHLKHHMSTRLALALWSTYTLNAIYHTQSVPRDFVHTPSLYENWQSVCQPLIDRLTPNGLSPSVITQLNSHMEHLRNTQKLPPQPSAVIEKMDIFHIANDIYNAINQSNIEQKTLDMLEQRLITELSNPDYTHDIAQFDVLYHDQFLDVEGRIRTLNEKHNQVKQEQIRAINQQKQEQIRAINQQKQEQIRAINQQKQEQIRAINQQHALELSNQHKELSENMRVMHEQHNAQMNAMHQKFSHKITHLNNQIAELHTQYEHQIDDMRNALTNEITFLKDQISTMKSEIDWRTDTAHQQQVLIDHQQTIINQFRWVIRIVNFLRRIKNLGRKTYNS